MCPQCFATNEPSRKFCRNCGGLLREDGQQFFEIEDYILEDGLEKWRERK